MVKMHLDPALLCIFFSFLCLFSEQIDSFQCFAVTERKTRHAARPLSEARSSADTISSSPELAVAASKFKVLTCMSTSCCKKRKDLGLDSLATFAAFYSRSKGGGEEPTIVVEEGPCLGACKKAPCVAVEHEDFVGSVSLEGMTDGEFSDRVFHNIITEEDADRVWDSVINAVQVMAEADQEDGQEV